MKKLMCIFLSAVMLLGLVPVTAAAEEPSYTDAEPKNVLEVGWNGPNPDTEEYWYRDNNEPGGQLPVGVTFDAASDTLTLSGADIDFISATDWGTNELKIVVSGTNSIHAYHGRSGISLTACHNVTVSGDGTLDIEVVGRNEDTENEGFGNYGTPFTVWDNYVVERGEDYHGEDDHVYPDGHIVFNGVTVNLTNPENEISLNRNDVGQEYWGSAHNACVMDVYMASMELTGGAKLTGVGMDGISLATSLTVGSDAEITASSLDVRGIYGDADGRCFATTTTVSGTITVTGDGYDAVTENTDHVRDIYRSSLRVDPGATLVLNEGGNIRVTAPASFSGCGVEVSAPHYIYDLDGKPTDLLSPEELGAGHVKINGGTLTVKGARNGISVNSGASWTQSAGTVTVNVNGDIGYNGNMSGGVNVSGDENMFVKTATFTQSGGAVNINMDMGEPTEVGEEWSADGTEYAPGFGMYGDVTYTMSGEAELNVNYTGTGNGWTPGVHLNVNYDENGNPRGGSPEMTMSDSAAVTVDYTGFKGKDDRTGVAGFSVETGAALTVNAGATVAVTLPDGYVGDASGLNIFDGTVTTGGKITVTSPEALDTNNVQGLNIGGDESQSKGSLTVEGGTVDVNLSGAVVNGGAGISAHNTTQVNFKGGTVNVTSGVMEKGGNEWHSSIGMDAYDGVEIAVGEGANVKFTVLKCNEDTDGDSERVGIKLNERCSYTQAPGSSVTISGGGEDDGYLWYTFEGMHLENRSRAGINGELTIEKEIDGGIILYSRSTLEVGNRAQITYDARGTAMGDGIIASDYSDIVISGGQIDLDMPIAPLNMDEDGTYWMTGGISLNSSSTADITGGVININKKTPREYDGEDFQTMGVTITNGFLRMTGGELNAVARIPVGATNSTGTADPITLAGGICALYAEGTEYGDRVLGGYEVQTYTRTDGSSYAVTDYVLDPENPGVAQEFGVTIKNQSARAEYSALLELVNSGAVIAGLSYTARLTASLPDGSDTVTLSVDKGTIEENSVSVNGVKAEAAAYAGGNKSVSLTVNSGDIVRFNVIPGAGANTVTASFTEANESAASTFTAKDYALELPTSTDKESVVVSGVAAMNTAVRVFVDGVSAATAEANNAGVWSTTITLPSEGEHTVYAMIGDNRTGNRTITYAPTVPVVESLKVSNWIHGNTSVDPNQETSFTINFVDPAKSTPGKYYTYWPELPEFTFTVKFSQGADRVADVRVVATDWKGTEETAYLSLNAETLEWSGVHDFCDGEHITPEQFRVEWRNLEDGAEGQTPEYELPGEDSPGLPASREPAIRDDVNVDEDGNYKPSSTIEIEEADSALIETDGTSVTITLSDTGAAVGIKIYDFLGNDVTDTMTVSGTSVTVTGQPGDLFTVEGSVGDFAEYLKYGTILVKFTGGGSRRVIEYKSGVTRIEKDFDEEELEKHEDGEILVFNDCVIKVTATGYSEEVGLADVYDKLDISGFEGAELSWDQPDAQTYAAFRQSAIYSALEEAAINAVSEEIQSRGIPGLEYELTVGENELKLELNGELDEDSNTVTVELGIDISFHVTATLPKDRVIDEDVSISLSFTETDVLDYRITLDSNDDFASYLVTDSTKEFGISVDITPSSGDDDGGEGTDTDKFFDEEALKKELEDLEEGDDDDSPFKVTPLRIVIPPVPGLEFYVQASIENEREITGELTLGATVTLKSSSSVYVLKKANEEGEKVKKSATSEPPEVKGNVTLHAQLEWSIKPRFEIGFTYGRSIKLGAFIQAGPELNIEGQAVFEFGPGVKPDLTMEGNLSVALVSEIGICASVSLFGWFEQEASFVLIKGTHDLFKAGSNEMPTRFEVLEKDATTVWDGSYVSQFVDMRVHYQTFSAWNSPEEHAEVMAASDYAFELVTEDKPVEVDEATGKITISDGKEAFDFLVKVIYKSDHYDIFKVVPLHYTPSAITIIKTTEGGGPRTASFTVVDMETAEFKTCATTASGKAMVDAEAGRSYAIVETNWPAGYYPVESRKVVTAEATGTTVDFYNKKLPDPDEPEQNLQSTPNEPRSSCGDPSGFVYEGIESNRLKDVTTTLYKSQNPDGSGAALWSDAESYDQMNPLTTDALGQYLWMVPSGYWQVKYELKDYETEYSSWMEVPPVRTGVNQNMTNNSPATASVEYSEELGAYILRFNRPVQISSVANDLTVTVSGLGDNIVPYIDISPVDAGWSDTGNDSDAASTLCATTFIAHIDANMLIDPDNDIWDYYQLPEGADFSLDGTVKTYMGTNSSIDIEDEVQVPTPPANTYRVIVVNGTGNGSYEPGAVVKVSPDARSGYTFTGWDVESAIPVTVGSDGTFVMPACEVLLTATYKQSGNSHSSGRTGSGKVTLPGSVENGSVTSNRSAAAPGSTVTVTAKPNEGYLLAELTVLDSAGNAVALTDNGDGTYSFRMPAGGVTVKAVFKCAGGETCLSRQFTDLDAAAWYHEYTDYVIEKELMRGVGGTLFDPDGTATRAQMVTVLWNMEGDPTVDYDMSYSDVSDTDWFADAIRWATSVGVVDGCGNGKFCPNDTITREQMATMLYRYELKCGEGAAGGEQSELKFADAERVSSWALEAVTWCGATGIITGKDNNSFDPSGSAKRCELAAVLMRYCQKLTTGEG